ncbi:drug resistance transporter, EmrB/QacA subfamily [Streptomyces sp. 2231.1]|uniref:MFS transporter n=1 Tax=Streptomyces sp. 2231.1 TaxID=1855347 RepID=UPI00089D3AC0|nr:MFS transporter [Streptomyces sp. 2231.1]SED99440.1 drug resistance transporter, EmrB/QacA subfamily [Streptomyces sp. 2231.1]
MQDATESHGRQALPPPSPPDPRRWWMLGVLSLALFLIILNNGLLNVALPSLMRDLHAGIGTTQWIVDGYALVFAACLLTAGTLSDRYGRKRATLLGAALFGVGTLIALAARDAGQLIAARTVMGVAAALVMPGTLSILVNVFPEAERPRAIAVWGATSALGVAAGPVLGGALVAHFWWGSVFLVNLLPVAVVLVAGALLLPESAAPVPRPADPVGAVLGSAAMVGLVYGAIHASGEGWTSAPVLGSFVAALLAGAGFAGWERRHPSPLVDFALLCRPAFLGAGAGNMLLFSGMSGTLFVLTQFLQFGLGYSPLRAGLSVAPVAVAVGAGSALSPWAARRTGPRGAVAGGLAVSALGILSLAQAGTYPGILLSLCLMGIGVGVALAPATDAVLALVPPERSGNAAALNDTMQELGNAVGVAVVGTVLARESGTHLAGGATGDRVAAAAPAGFTAAAAIVALGAVLSAVLLRGPARGPAGSAVSAGGAGEGTPARMPGARRDAAA